MFWPLLLIAFGILFLLDNFNLLPGNAWNWLWPIVLIFVGVNLLLRRGVRAEPVEDSASLDGATSARINFKHGAGVLDLRGGAGADELFHGEFAGGIDKRLDRQGDHIDVTLQPSERDGPQWFLPWNWGGQGLDWQVRLTPNARLALLLETGASDTRLDLTDLRVSELNVKTGASSTRVVLPARAGSTGVRIASGAASVDVTVPSGVAARIRGSVGVGSLDVDQHRFPRRNGGYESTDYETAANRAEIQVESGVGSVRVR
jgi:hypothetical protein